MSILENKIVAEKAVNCEFNVPNHTERIIRQFVLARNNFMFADTVKGAESLCMHFSIIQTAILNGVEPYDYYCRLFKELPHCQTVDDYECLLPWNISQNNLGRVS